MTIYCPTCNRSSDECRFIGEFCEFCAGSKLKMDVPDFAKISQCRFCERLKIKGEYVDMNMDSLGRALKYALNIPEYIVDVEKYSNGMAYIYAHKETEPARAGVAMRVRVRVIHATCRRCFRVSAGYYQGVVQLRGNRMKIERIKEQMKRYLERREEFISKEEKQTNGIDLYVSSKQAANSFFMDFKLKPEKSFRLYGMKRGMKVYRNTYSLHV